MRIEYFSVDGVIFELRRLEKAIISGDEGLIQRYAWSVEQVMKEFQADMKDRGMLPNGD